MKTLKKSVAATLVTLLFTGFALAGENEKGKRKGKGKGKNKAPAVKVESGTVDLDALTRSLGAENGEELAKMGAKLLGDILSTEEGRQMSKALAENGAQLLGQMMSGENGDELNIDLSQLLGGGGQLPEGMDDLLQHLAGSANKPSVKASGKAVIIGPDGKKREIDLSEGANLLKALQQRHGVPKGHAHEDHEHKHDAKDSDDDGDKDQTKPEMRLMGKAIIIGPDGKKREIDLGKGGLPKAFMLRHGGGDDHDKGRLEWRKHEEPDHEDDEGEDENDEEIELLEEISEQMERQNELLEEILERLDK